MHIWLLIAVVSIFMFITTSTISAAEKGNFIYDEAGLFTDQELEQLEQQATNLAKESDIHYIYLTYDGSHQDIERDLEDFIDAYSDQFETDPSLIILGIDIDEAKRDVAVVGSGPIYDKKRMEEDRSGQIREKITPYLSDENYVQAYKVFIETSEEYVKYRSFVNPESIFFNLSTQIIIGLLIGAIMVGYYYMRRFRDKYSVTSQTYLNNDSTKILRKGDRYSHTTVTKVRKPKNNRGGGGSSGGGSFGGSTSGGRSFGGSRGKF